MNYLCNPCDLWFKDSCSFVFIRGSINITRHQIEKRRVKNGKQKLEQILSDDGGNQRRHLFRHPKPTETNAEHDSDEQNCVEYLTCHRTGVVPNPTGRRRTAMRMKIPFANPMEEPNVPQLRDKIGG